MSDWTLLAMRLWTWPTCHPPQGFPSRRISGTEGLEGESVMNFDCPQTKLCSPIPFRADSVVYMLGSVYSHLVSSCHHFPLVVSL